MFIPDHRSSINVEALQVGEVAKKKSHKSKSSAAPGLSLATPSAATRPSNGHGSTAPRTSDGHGSSAAPTMSSSSATATRLSVTAAYLTRRGKYAAMTTGSFNAPKKMKSLPKPVSASSDEGCGSKPIMLLSSPATPAVPSKRGRPSQAASPISLSSTASSPIPSPTRKARRIPRKRAKTLKDDVTPALVLSGSSLSTRMMKAGKHQDSLESQAEFWNGEQYKGMGSSLNVDVINKEMAKLKPNRKEEGKKKGKDKGKAKEREDCYIVCLPDEAEPYMKKTIELCSTVAVGGQEKLWVELAAAYVALEVVRGYKAGELDSDGRPQAVGTWIKHARLPRYHPAFELKDFWPAAKTVLFS
ncbi:hypothetical protein V5O48_016207 [Marasmius crinis-equi]|uniref:Uncharacterized protein n=1 Tax=Marasmius crinis-equi TaxID=585013 RepID=A0ABR3ESD3_9AGAR